MASFDIPLLVKFFAVIVGIIFAFAGATKIPNIRGFRILVKSYGLLPVWMANISAPLLPFVEVLLGMALIFQYELKVMSIAAVLFQGIFIIFLIYGYKLNKALENCGCFGTAIPIKLDLKKIFTDIGFLVVEFALVVLVWFG